MRREPEFFGDQELVLVYIAKRLKEALKLEQFLTQEGIDYMVEPDTYRGGLIFATERVGAFFYTVPEIADQTRKRIATQGYAPYSSEG